GSTPGSKRAPHSFLWLTSCLGDPLDRPVGVLPMNFPDYFRNLTECSIAPSAAAIGIGAGWRRVGSVALNRGPRGIFFIFSIYRGVLIRHTVTSRRNIGGFRDFRNVTRVLL